MYSLLRRKKPSDAMARYWCLTAIPRAMESCGISAEIKAGVFFTETGVGMVLRKFSKPNTGKACLQTLKGIFRMLARGKYIGRDAIFPEISGDVTE